MKKIVLSIALIFGIFSSKNLFSQSSTASVILDAEYVELKYNDFTIRTCIESNIHNCLVTGTMDRNGLTHIKIEKASQTGPYIPPTFFFVETNPSETNSMNDVMSKAFQLIKNGIKVN